MKRGICKVSWVSKLITTLIFLLGFPLWIVVLLWLIWSDGDTE